MPISKDDIINEFLKSKGRDPKYRADFLRSQGESANIVLNEPDLDENDVSKIGDPDTSAVVWEQSALSEWLKTEGYASADADELLTAIDAGLATVAKGKKAMQDIHDTTSGGFSTFARRAGNFLELTLGQAGNIFDTPRQAVVSALAGRSKDEIIAAAAPWARPDRPMGQHQSVMMDAARQLDELFRAGMTGDTEKMAFLLDVEPNIVGSQGHADDYNDVIIQQGFDGDEDAYDAWLSDIMQKPGGKFLPGIIGTAGIIGENIIDPLFWGGAGFTKVASKAPLLKNLIKTGGKMDAARAATLEAKIIEQLRPHKRTLPKTLEALKAAEDNHAARLSQLEGDPKNLNKWIKSLHAEVALADAHTAARRFQQGDAVAISLRKTPRTSPKFIDRKEQKAITQRREELANGLVSKRHRRRALKEAGLTSNEKKLRQQLAASTKAMADGDDSAVHFDIVSRWHTLPKRVQEALDVKHVSAPKFVRAAALGRDPIDLSKWSNLDDFKTLHKRSVMGPDDVEAAGDAAKALTEGAGLGDVSIYGVPIPEYKVIGVDMAPGYTHADGLWVKEMVDERTMTQLSRLGDRQKPGLSVNSIVLTPLNALRGAHKWAMIWGREPRGFLKGTGVFERATQADNNYLLELTATNETFSKAFIKAGIASKDKYGRVRIKPELDQQLFDLLDHEPKSEEFIKAVKDATPGMRELAAKTRQWLNMMAERQSIPLNKRVSSYARHLFPDREFANGRRPIVYEGIGAKVEVPAGHLMPRLGALGYAKDSVSMIEAYARASLNKIHMQAGYEDMMKLAKADGRQSVMRYTEAMVNDMQGKPSTLEKWVDETFAAAGIADRLPFNVPPPSKWGMALSNIYYSSLLGGNINYLIENLGTGALNPLGKFGALHTARGVLRFATPEGRALAKKAGIIKQSKAIFESKKLNPITNFLSQAVVQTEFIARGISFHASMSKLVKDSGFSLTQLAGRGMIQSVLAHSANAASIVQHAYGALGRSPMLGQALGRSIAAPAIQFASFPFKQTGFLFSAAKQDPGFIMRFFAYSGLAQRLMEDELNIDASRWTGIGYLPMAGSESMQESPALTAMSSLIEYSQAAASGDPLLIEKAAETVTRNMETLIPGIPPLKRVFEAADRLSTGQITTSDDEKVRMLTDREMVPTLLTVRSMDQKKQNDFDKQFREQRRNQMFWARQRAEALKEAIDSGDNSKARQLEEDLASVGILFSQSPSTKFLELQAVPRLLRQIEQNALFFPPDLLSGQEAQRGLVAE